MFCVQIDSGKQAEAERHHWTHHEEELVLEIARVEKELAAIQAYKAYCEAMALQQLSEDNSDLEALFN